MTDAPSANQPLVFRSQLKVGQQAGIAFVVAGLGLVLLLFNFGLTIIGARPATGGPDLMRTASTVIPGLMITFSLIYAGTVLSNPVRVTLDGEGMTIEGLMSRRRVMWNAIARLRRGELEGLGASYIKAYNKSLSTETLELLDERGKKIVALPAFFENFAALAAEIEARTSAARGAETFTPEQQSADNLKRQRRKMVTNAVLGLILVAMGAACGFGLIPEMLRERAVFRDRVEVQGTITQHFMRRVTPIVEYQWTDATGRTQTRETSLREEAWEGLAAGDPVPVLILPDRPDYSRLAIERPKHKPAEIAFLGFGMTAMILLGLLSFLMPMFKIVDIKVEPGGIKLVRLGDPPPAPAAVQQTAAAPPAWIRGGASASAPSPAQGTPSAPPAAVAPPVFAPAVVQAPIAPNQDGLPGGIKALGVLNIVYGVFIAGINALRLMMVLLVSRSGEYDISGDGTYVVELDTWTLVLAGLEQIVMISLGFLLAAAGGGLLMRRRWGRICSVLMGWLFVVAGAVYMYLLATGGIFNYDEMPEDMRGPARGAIVLAGMAIVCLSVYPLVMAVLLGRKSAKEFFRRQRPGEIQATIVQESGD